MSRSRKKSGERVDCMRCKHFYITWQADSPRGCRAFAFKTRELPSAVVERASGEPCQLFELKVLPRRRRT